MTPASSIPMSSTLKVLSQNINGFQTKITMRKRKQKRIVALGSLLRSLEVDFFAIQEPHFVTVEDRQAGMQCLSKYGYGLDGPLHEEGRGGVALAWKTSKWTLRSMKFLSPRALKASLLSGPLEITVVVVHFHHKHTRRQSQWKDTAKELHGPNLILCADHNSLLVKHRDAFAPPEFEHDTSFCQRPGGDSLGKSGSAGCLGGHPLSNPDGRQGQGSIMSDGLHIRLPSRRRATRPAEATPY